MKIGEISRITGVSIDTLRYYEKIHLLDIERTSAGIRVYSDKDTHTIRFIKRAQKIGFSLEDISQLIHFRENPINDKSQVREMISDKLRLIHQRIEELQQLERELSVLVAECQDSVGDCPILKKLEEK